MESEQKNRSNDGDLLKYNKKFHIISEIILICLEIGLIIIFLFYYYISPNSSVFYFLGLLLNSILLFLNSLYLIEKYEEKRKDMFQEFKESTILKIMNYLFRGLEDFPYEENLTGKKREFLKYFGWIFLIILFFGLVFIRNFYEAHVLRDDYTPFSLEFYIEFGLISNLFYIFVLSVGALAIHLITKQNISKAIKVLTIGIVILIQVPYIVDFFILGQVRTAAYNYVNWEDFTRLFNSFFLDPSLSYAFGIGHLVMTLLLMILSGFYVVFRTYFDFENKKKKIFLISLIKGIIMVFIIYSLVCFAFVSHHFLQAIIIETIDYLPTPTYKLLTYNFYFFAFILLLIQKIRMDDKITNKKRSVFLELKQMATRKQFDVKINREMVEKKFNSYLTLKYSLLIVLIFCFELFILYIL